MAFGIDDAVVEVATEEMVSEVGSSGSSSLESISENRQLIIAINIKNK